MTARQQHQHHLHLHQQQWKEGQVPNAEERLQAWEQQCRHNKRREQNKSDKHKKSQEWQNGLEAQVWTSNCRLHPCRVNWCGKYIHRHTRTHSNTHAHTYTHTHTQAVLNDCAQVSRQSSLHRRSVLGGHHGYSDSYSNHTCKKGQLMPVMRGYTAQVDP
eukprot:1033414-Pelagomonas_calceolata.AAC.3